MDLANRFGFTREEIVYCVSQLNGVRPTINLDYKYETIIANILAGEEFEPIPPGLPEKLLGLSFWKRIQLYAQIKDFWDSGKDYLIQDTERQLGNAGLIFK